MLDSVFEFKTRKLNHNGCLCDACGCYEPPITEVKIPITTVYLGGRETYKDLRYYYFCDKCKQKLMEALKEGEQE